MLQNQSDSYKSSVSGAGGGVVERTRILNMHVKEEKSATSPVTSYQSSDEVPNVRSQEQSFQKKSVQVVD